MNTVEIRDHIDMSLSAANVPVNFCQVWPEAEQLLPTIADLIAFFPNGAEISAVLGALIAIGNETYETTCPTPPAGT